MINKREAKVEMLKKIYPIGTKLVVEHMDDIKAVPSGTIGTVICIDSIGQIHCKEFGLALIDGVDKFHKI